MCFPKKPHMLSAGDLAAPPPRIGQQVPWAGCDDAETMVCGRLTLGKTATAGKEVNGFAS